MVCVGEGVERGGGRQGCRGELESCHTYKVYSMMNLIIQYEQRGLVLDFVFVLGLILYC